jgi:hypothetical protein
VPTKLIDDYEVEFTAEPLEGCDQWGAYVTIYAPSDNPMHMNNVYPKQRVSADAALPSQAAAEAEAASAALKILEQIRA